MHRLNTFLLLLEACSLRAVPRAHTRACPLAPTALPQLTQPPASLRLPLAWVSAPLEVHVLALYSNGTCGILACWLGRMAEMIRHERIKYHMHVKWHAHSAPTNASFAGSNYKDPLWVAATRARVKFVHGMLRSLMHQFVNGVFVLTDLDVLPLRPFSVLFSQLLEPTPRRDILFMREPAGHCGMTPWVANLGLVVMRNTKAVRAFWYHVLSSVRQSKMMNDQDVANWLLLKKYRPGELSWALLPDIATADVRSVSRDSAAFHAVGVSGDAKVGLLELGLRRHSLVSVLQDAPVSTPINQRTTLLSLLAPCDLVAKQARVPQKWMVMPKQQPAILNCSRRP